MKKDEARQLADRLLDQRVQHELAQFSRDRVLEELGRDLDILLEAADAITLREVVAPDTVKAIIARHTVERDMPAIIPEMAAEFTNHLVSQSFHRQATPSDIISRDRIEGFVDELLLLVVRFGIGASALLVLGGGHRSPSRSKSRWSTRR